MMMINLSSVMNAKMLMLISNIAKLVEKIFVKIALVIVKKEIIN